MPNADERRMPAARVLDGQPAAWCSARRAIGSVLPAGRVWAQAKATAAAAAAAAASSPESLVKVLYDTLSPKQRENDLLRLGSPGRRARPAADARRQQLGHHRALRQRRRFLHQGPAGDHPQHLRGHHQPRVARADRQAARRRRGRLRRAEQHRHLRQPGSEKFEFVMTGRHMTIRCDGNSAEHVAFGGPIFYGHAADGLRRRPDHPGNVFWPQAEAANKLYQMLDGSSRSRRCCERACRTNRSVGFRGKDGEFQGLPVTELSSDQKEHLQKVMAMLVEPYRQSDRDEVTQVPQSARRPRCLPPGVLRPERHRQGRRLGHLAAGRPVVRVALPRRAARARVGQRGG